MLLSIIFFIWQTECISYFEVASAISKYNTKTNDSCQIIFELMKLRIFCHTEVFVQLFSKCEKAEGVG